MKHKSVCLIGIFPPPLHGMSLITEYVRRRVSGSTTPLVVDCSPRSLDRSFVARFGKMFRVARRVLQFISYLLMGRVGAVYLGVSGGNGQIYDAIFVAISRAFGRKIYLHHHGYQYLDRHSWVAKMLMSVAGGNAIHVVACEKMAGDLKQKYPVVNQIRVISGIAAIEAWGEDAVPRSEIRAIGFLSNISLEKGILEFLDVAAWANQAGLAIRFYIAGPYQDEGIKCLVEQKLTSLNNVVRLGALYGDMKKSFFDSIDVFLLPSHNESEGLVIHEAMSRGAPVIAYSRGCIEQIVSDRVGLRLSLSESYVARAADKIEEWLLCPREFQLASQASLNRFGEARALHIKNMDALCIELIGS